MKVTVIKQPGGTLIPASDMESEKLTRFRSGDMYEIDIKQARNPSFHGKVFAFFNFCFAHWNSENEYQSEQAQFDGFRKDMTILAGYHDTYHRMDGSVRVEAKSLSYGAMEQAEFELLYNALIQVAMKRIFKGDDESTYQKLVGFF